MDQKTRAVAAKPPGIPYPLPLQPFQRKEKRGNIVGRKKRERKRKKRKVRRWDIIRKRSKGSGRRSVREKGSGEIEVGKLKDRRK